MEVLVLCLLQKALCLCAPDYQGADFSLDRDVCCVPDHRERPYEFAGTCYRRRNSGCWQAMPSRRYLAAQMKHCQACLQDLALQRFKILFLGTEYYTTRSSIIQTIFYYLVKQSVQVISQQPILPSTKVIEGVPEQPKRQSISRALKSEISKVRSKVQLLPILNITSERKTVIYIIRISFGLIQYRVCIYYYLGCITPVLVVITLFIGTETTRERSSRNEARIRRRTGVNIAIKKSLLLDFSPIISVQYT